MTLHLVDFFIIQAATTIADHLLEHRDNAAVKLGLVDHAIAVKVKLFCMNSPRLCDASSVFALARLVMILPDTRRPAPFRTGK